jgi:hypothetical protein
MTEVDLTKTKMLPKYYNFRSIFVSINPVWLDLVNPCVFRWNSLEQDLLLLYTELVELGVEHRNGEVYLADLEKQGLDCGAVCEFWLLAATIISDAYG